MSELSKLRHLSARGFRYSVCADPKEWYLDGPVGLWVGLFIFSKIPELWDTFYIVARQRPLLFLHWYHHVTVLLYCWHAFATEAPQALYFVAMNYSVHAIMYAYYACSAAKVKFCDIPMPMQRLPTLRILSPLQDMAAYPAMEVDRHMHGRLSHALGHGGKRWLDVGANLGVLSISLALANPNATACVTTRKQASVTCRAGCARARP